MKEYEVFLEVAEEGGYTVTCPALPGCISEGDTREEARQHQRCDFRLFRSTSEARKTRA